jgi:hypothetical protein
MPRTNIAGFKLVFVIAAAFALVFVIFGGLVDGYSLRSITLLASAGAVISAIGAPDIEPKAFRYPTLWQMFFSVLGCTLLALYREAGAQGYALAIVAGIILGYLAPYWVKHFQGP